MSKNIISIFFVFILMAFITAPVVIIMVEDSLDVSYFNSITEEEEKVREIKVLQNNDSNDLSGFHRSIKNMNKAYFFKKYSKPHLNIISPPPDFL